MPKSFGQIYERTDTNTWRVQCFDNNFRASIPIYKKGGCYYTTYDWDRNKIANSDTIFVSVHGSDRNDGLTRGNAKLTINAALCSNRQTIVLLEGTYMAGINFENNTTLANINFIGEGDVVIDNNGDAPFNVVGAVYIRNISFTNGNKGSLRTFLKDKNTKCTYVECKFNNSIIDDEKIGKAKSLGGLRIQGGTHFLYKCVASDNGYDGFNYHAAPDGSGNSPHVVEVECYAFNNGVYNQYESNNASTAHDGTHIVRLNCVYNKSHGGIVADVDNATVSCGVGCTASSSMDLGTKYRHYQANYFCASNATMYLLGCKSTNSMYDLTCLNKATVFSDVNYSRKFIEDGNFSVLQ